MTGAVTPCLLYAFMSWCLGRGVIQQYIFSTDIDMNDKQSVYTA